VAVRAALVRLRRRSHALRRRGTARRPPRRPPARQPDLVVPPSQLHPATGRGGPPGDRRRPPRLRALRQAGPGRAVHDRAALPAPRCGAGVARPARRDCRAAGLGRPDRPVVGDQAPGAAPRPVRPQHLRPPPARACAAAAPAAAVQDARRRRVQTRAARPGRSREARANHSGGEGAPTSPPTRTGRAAPQSSSSRARSHPARRARSPTFWPRSRPASNATSAPSRSRSPGR
jgi:hypothetical protein